MSEEPRYCCDAHAVDVLGRPNAPCPGFHHDVPVWQRPGKKAWTEEKA
jgi:hypothetical protein